MRWKAPDGRSSTRAFRAKRMAWYGSLLFMWPTQNFSGATLPLLIKLSQSPLRMYVWLVLLEAPIMSTDEYLSLIHRGASPAYAKIRNDTFRTLTTDPLFRRRVSEASLIRLLNAAAWRLHDAKDEQRQSSRPSSSHSTAPRPSFGGSVSGHSQASACRMSESSRDTR